ncbi:MAG: hypothetical protein IIX22_05630, partial [Ruminococcus sp.]|nr:hypothetical protein [Ruminococcus sp.]
MTALTQSDAADDALLVEQLGTVVDPAHIFYQNVQSGGFTRPERKLDLVHGAGPFPQTQEFTVQEH